MAETERMTRGSSVLTTYADDDLADGRAALLSGWSSGSEPGLVITRASGALVWDAKGNEYIDCTSMAWSNNIGASVPEVVEAAFAQARDKMLPGSGLLGHVNAATRTPVGSILLVAAAGIGINLLSAGVAANVVSICSVAYYFIYVLTVGGAIYAHRKKNMPAGRPGDFTLGRWFMPVAVVAFGYTAGVIVIALAPHEGHTAALYLSGAEVVGVLWYLLYLRRRIADQSAGVLRKEVVELESSAV